MIHGPIIRTEYFNIVHIGNNRAIQVYVRICRYTINKPNNRVWDEFIVFYLKIGDE